MRSTYIGTVYDRLRRTSTPTNFNGRLRLASRSTRLSSHLRKYTSSNAFDYNAEYFQHTKARLVTDSLTGNRGLFAKEELGPNEVIFVTPYYHHVIHAALQPHFCNSCHDSFQLLGLSDTALRSKHIKSHLYCSKACRERGEPYDEAMSSSLKSIQKRDPDFYVTNADNIKAVLFALSRKYLEQKKAPSESFPCEPVAREARLGRPIVLKEHSLLFEDLERLCTLDVGPLSLIPSREKQRLKDTDERMRFLLYDSPLMSLGITPLEILTRDAANSFALDKYDSKSGVSPSRPRPEPSGFATYPLASYLNHNCQPTCAFSFDMDANIVIRTTTSIEEGEELTICYNPEAVQSPVKSTQSDKNRMQRCKKMCKDVWGFECDCA